MRTKNCFFQPQKQVMCGKKRVLRVFFSLTNFATYLPQIRQQVTILAPFITKKKVLTAILAAFTPWKYSLHSLPIAIHIFLDGFYILS